MGHGDGHEIGGPRDNAIGPKDGGLEQEAEFVTELAGPGTPTGSRP
jgi:hypothetical protein